MSIIAGIVGCIGLGVIVGVMVWLTCRPEPEEMRTPLEWEQIYRIRITSWDGFGKLITEPMTSREFLGRARLCTYRAVPRQVADVGTGGGIR